MRLLRDLVPWQGSQVRTPSRMSENPITALRREMDTLFDDFFGGFPWSSGALLEGRVGSFSPRVEIKETDKEVIVRAELPGMSEKDLDVSYTDNHLTIRGEKKRHEEKNEEDRYYCEASYGSFERLIPLTVEIDQDKVDASMKDGVLTIRLPKTPQAQKRTVKVGVRADN